MTPIPFANSYSQLPARFYSREQPTPVASPVLIRANHGLARLLGIDPDWLASPEAVQVFAGNQLPPGAEPIATVYAGHQFGGWNPQLGDGRAILLGEVVAADGHRYDIQLKGAGPTPYSRGGDGRSPLGPVVREYLVSEAMAALGIPTTRSLAAVTSGEPVYRNSVLPGAILTRVARSHIRVGHFQYFLARKDEEAIQLLADHLIARDFPEALESANPYRDLLAGAIARQAQLIAQWQLVGFIHGVMNTDNMLICGETVDYGPCAFMDSYHPDTCFSSIDHGKRYAYKNQPAIGHWNLSWLAQSLLPLLDQDEERAIAAAQEALDSFSQLYQHAYTAGMHRKFGLESPSRESHQFIEDFMAQLASEGLDYTLAFRHLADLTDSSDGGGVEFSFPESFAGLLGQWRKLCGQGQQTPRQRQLAMYLVNPAVIPRNHLVEEAIRAAEDKGDFAPFHQLLEVLATPFQLDPENSRYTLPPQPHQVVHKTFCGT